MAKGKWEVKGTVNCHADPVFFHTDIVCGGIRVARATGVGFDASIATAKLIAEAPETLRQRDALLTALQKQQHTLDMAILATPTGETRNMLTEINIERLDAIALTK